MLDAWKIAEKVNLELKKYDSKLCFTDGGRGSRCYFGHLQNHKRRGEFFLGNIARWHSRSLTRASGVPPPSNPGKLSTPFSRVAISHLFIPPRSSSQTCQPRLGRPPNSRKEQNNGGSCGHFSKKSSDSFESGCF